MSLDSSQLVPSRHFIHRDTLTAASAIYKGKLTEYKLNTTVQKV